MASSAIVARLQLDSKDYDRKLAEAKKKTRDFSKGGGNDLEAMAGKFKTLAVAVAGSKAVMETFNAVVKSSQTIGDAYTIALSQARGSVDEFVYAMANADFSGFNNGLRGIMSNAKEAAAAMDALGNAQISYDYLAAGYRSSFKTNIAAAKDKSLSSAEREAAYNAAMDNMSSMEQAVTGYTDKIVKAVVDNAVAKANNINRDFVTRENIDRILELDLMPGGDEEKARLKAIYDQYKDIREQQMAYQREADRFADKLANGEQYTRNPLTGNMELNIYKAANLQRRRDEAQAEADRLNAMVATNAEYQQAALYNAMLVKGSDEWLQEMTSLIIKADNAKGSLAEMQTATYEVANALRTATQEAAKLDKVVMTGAQYAQSFGIGFYESLLNKGSIGSRVAAAQRGEMATIHEDVPIIDTTLEDEELDTTAVENYYAALETLDSVSVSASDDMGALGSAVANLSGLLGEGGAAWGNYVSGIMSAIGQAIPTIEALATAQASAAATTAALNPWNVVATVAAVSSVIAAMSQIPKFATGGVVPGNRLSGDNVLIRANSGEVVLTKTQANNIGTMLSGGLGGKVVFKIEGSTLVGVLNNHNRIAGRSYGYKNG